MQAAHALRAEPLPNMILVGAGPGLGEAIAARFIAGGFRVGLIARSADALAQMQDRLGAQAFSHAADAGVPDSLEAALSDLTTRLGPCDVLIYNAAVLKPGLPLDVAPETLAAELSVNVLGAHQAARHVAPAMIEKGHGAILFTGGGLAHEPFPEWAALAAGKAALRSLSLSLYKQLAPHGVHVSVIAVCGIVAPGGPFAPKTIAEEYWRLATAPQGLHDREVVFQPPGTDPLYNDPDRVHAATTLLPPHARG
ncbi:MAG: SDR family NAD(P)-dependent oxidoreductase [Pseudomonadota bacterium]